MSVFTTFAYLVRLPAEWFTRRRSAAGHYPPAVETIARAEGGVMRELIKRELIKREQIKRELVK